MPPVTNYLKICTVRKKLLEDFYAFLWIYPMSVISDEFGYVQYPKVKKVGSENDYFEFDQRKASGSHA